MNLIEIVWRPPPPLSSLSLGMDEVHVWQAALDVPRPLTEFLYRTLSHDELCRANRFRFEKDSSRFVVARGLLRCILGRYLGVEPSRLRFCYSPHGKPFLEGQVSREAYGFNLAHSDGLALYAVTRGRAIGVDVERILMDFAWEQIASQLFSPRENAMLGELPDKVKQEAFFACWTQKEAYLKARSSGLSLPLCEFEVFLSRNEPVMLVSQEGKRKTPECWSLCQLRPAPGYAAALAVEGFGWRLACWKWAGDPRCTAQP